MIDVLHASALAPAALGTCCVAADRGRARAADLAASALMTIAMLDAVVLRVVPAVWWACALVAAALAYAATTRTRRADRAVPAGSTAMTVHAGIGLVVMAALLLFMASPAGMPDAGHHGHGPGDAIVLPLVAGYGGASAWFARRGPALERLQFAAMGAATVLMGIAALL